MQKIRENLRNLKKYEKIGYFYLILVIIVSLIFLTIKKIYCFDIWWHLATGKLILSKHIIPHKDYFSYTFEHKKWIDSLWLFQVIIYKIYQIGKYNGLIIFKVIIIALSTFVLIKTFIENRLPKDLALIISLLVLWASSFRFNVRPHILSFLYISIFWMLLLRIKNKENILKENLILIIVYILWVNTHGSFIIGLGLSTFFLLEISLKYRNLTIQEAIKEKDLKRYLGITIILILCTLINPYGIDLIKFVLFSHTGNDATKYIAEWLPLKPINLVTFKLNKLLFLQLLITGIIGSLLTNKKYIIKQKEKLIWILWIAGLLYLSIKHSRFIGLLTFGSAPLFIIFSESLKINKSILLKYKVISIILISIFLIQNINSPKTRASWGFGIKWENYPKDIAEYIKKNNLPNNIFNQYGIGGFLIWKLYPKYKVFIDGRTPSLYTPNFYWEYRMIEEYPRLAWSKADKKYNFKTIVTNNKKLASYLIKEKNYNLLGFDDNYYLLSTEKKIRIIKIYRPNIKIDELKNKKEELKELIEELIYVSKNFPESAKALNILGSIYIEKDPKKALQYFLEALKRRKYDYNVMTNIGITYINLKNYKQAYKYLKKSLNYNNKNLTTLKYIIRTCYFLKKYKEGLKYAKIYFDQRIDYSDPRDYEYMGLLLYENNKFKKAIDYFKRALFLEKKKDYIANILYNIGNCYLAIGDTKGAKKYYLEVLKINPKHKLTKKALKELL